MLDRVLLWIVVLFLGGTVRCASDESAARLVAVSSVPTNVADVPFVCGALDIPPWSVNDEGVLHDQILPGMTHIQMSLDWRGLELEKDHWDWAFFDKMVAMSQAKGLKIAVQPTLMYAPAWFQQTPNYQTLVNMQTGDTVDFLSPYAPGTEAAYDHFFAALADHFRHHEIDQIDVEYPGSDFGEVGLWIGGKGFLPSGNFSPHFPQDPAKWKAGFWCGDPWARADFHQRMLGHYGGLAQLNAAWGTSFDSPEHIDFPDPATCPHATRRWVDFMLWIHESQARNLAKYLAIVRKHFPDALLNVPMGFGSDQATMGCDRTGVGKACADFQPIVIRSTHAGFNRGRWPLAYWFYKRMAPVAHRMGEGFGVEPPGGDLKANEMHRVIFEDASAGVSFVYHYYQNFHAFPDVIGAYKRALRPQEQSLVDIGVLFPTTQMLIDNPPFPPGQIEFCDSGREYFDYDLVDENMIGWDMLKNYRVLVHTGGKIFREASLPAIGQWLRSGGVLITRGLPQWQDIGGGTAIAAGWLAKEDASVALPHVRAYAVGKGEVYAVMADKIDDYLPTVVSLLAKRNAAQPLHGFKEKNDGTYITDFPDGRLVFDEKTSATTFVPKR